MLFYLILELFFFLSHSELDMKHQLYNYVYIIHIIAMYGDISPYFVIFASFRFVVLNKKRFIDFDIYLRNILLFEKAFGLMADFYLDPIATIPLDFDIKSDCWWFRCNIYGHLQNLPNLRHHLLINLLYESSVVSIIWLL